MITTAVFDTKPYDREQLQRTSVHSGIDWRFLEFRLTKETAATAKGAQAVCVFVNDQLDRPCLEARTTVANLEALAGGKSYVEGSVLT